jgi:hypothetical protein
MVRWPSTDRMSSTSKGIIERFQKTAAAKELEQDPREWVLENWPWVPDPPYTLVVRSSDDEERRLVMEGDGMWTSHTSRSPTHNTAA